MSYHTPIDEVPAISLSTVLEGHARNLVRGKCPYCKRAHGEMPPCKFPYRHFGEEPIPTLLAVAMERARQEDQWGEQNHPDGTGGYLLEDVATMPSFDWLRDHQREVTNQRDKEGRLTFGDILLEEVFEAMAEGDTDALRVELIQVAAVALAWVEAIDRRTDCPDCTDGMVTTPGFSGPCERCEGAGTLRGETT